MDRSVRYKGRSHEYGEREREKKHWLFADCASMPWDCAYRRDRVPPAGTVSTTSKGGSLA